MSGSWKVAYADFVTAMMAFFLLMWILAQVPDEKKAALQSYFASGGQNVGDTGITIIDETPPSSSSDQPVSSGAKTSIEVTRFINQILRENGLEEKVRVASTEAGVILRVQSGVMFAANQIALDKDGFLLLNAAAATIRHFKMNLAVRGHADSREGSSDGYYSPWEISSLRAAVVTRYLVEQSSIDPGLIASVFFGATRPIVPDTASPENRRVEFFFHRPEFSHQLFPQ
jgi:chemotaxis protein MotB